MIVTVIFSFIALPNTNINGRDISYASKDEALKKPAESFDIKVVGRDGRDFTIDLDDISYRASIPEDASIDQNPFKWPLSFLNIEEDDFSFDYKVDYDEGKLEEIVKSSALMTSVTEPKNASLDYVDGQFKIIPEEMGNMIDYNSLADKIKDAIYNHKEEIALEDSDYINPTVKQGSKELEKLLADGKKIEGLEIGLDFNGFDFKLAGKDFIEMFDINGTSFELNYEKVTSYMEDVAQETNTYGKNRTFNATGIGEIGVNPGVYGFILDVPSTVDEVYALANERKSGTVEPVYERAGYMRYEDGTDLKDTYVEVDISRQYMWFYKSGELVLESPIVTGLPTYEWGTNVGVGSIQSKSTNATLRGADMNGGRYATPVSYWMPIGWDGEGFHDAPWRGGFGGSIYYSNGSHGCLNMPPAMAAALFESVDYGTPVVVYESSTSNSPAMNY